MSLEVKLECPHITGGVCSVCAELGQRKPLLLDLPLDDDARKDSGADTIGGYLCRLLLVLFEEGEGFSGKRPDPDQKGHLPGVRLQVQEVRILVTGGRNFVDKGMVYAELDALHEYTFSSTDEEGMWVIQGGAPGADSLALAWTRDRKSGFGYPGPDDRVHELTFRARWQEPCRMTCKPGHRKTRADGSSYCPAAGVYRNQEMLDSGVDLVLAFPGGVGTHDMITRAEAAGVEVVRAYDRLPSRDLR
jgi:hypothetical protein